MEFYGLGNLLFREKMLRSPAYDTCSKLHKQFPKLVHVCRLYELVVWLPTSTAKGPCVPTVTDTAYIYLTTMYVGVVNFPQSHVS